MIANLTYAAIEIEYTVNMSGSYGICQVQAEDKDTLETNFPIVQ